jgi:hypothetical protein
MYELWIEGNLGLYGVGDYGLDTVALGYQGESGIVLQGQTIGAMATDDFFFGHFGLHPKSSNWSSFENTTQSFMHNLKAQNMIPSVSWGYTAGAPYRT